MLIECFYCTVVLMVKQLLTKLNTVDTLIYFHFIRFGKKRLITKVRIVTHMHLNFAGLMLQHIKLFKSNTKLHFLLQHYKPIFLYMLCYPYHDTPTLKTKTLKCTVHKMFYLQLIKAFP